MGRARVLARPDGYMRGGTCHGCKALDSKKLRIGTQLLHCLARGQLWFAVSHLPGADPLYCRRQTLAHVRVSVVSYESLNFVHYALVARQRERIGKHPSD